MQFEERHFLSEARVIVNVYEHHGQASSELQTLRLASSRIGVVSLYYPPV